MFVKNFIFRTEIMIKWICRFLKEIYILSTGKISTIELLISRGATVDAQDVDGETALHKAMWNKNFELTNLLIQACPKLQNITDHKGRLPSEGKGNEWYSIW